MNLRDKLNAISKPKITVTPVEAPPVKQYTDCWHGRAHYPMRDFPFALDVRRETVMLMQGEEMPDGFDPMRILYLDTETTGLGGGAGTVAFEVGLGWLEEDGFHVHQLLMRDYPEEKFLLEEIVRTADRFDVICTFNGKTFDLPLLRNRFIMNRIRTACLDKPHIDLLHIARRVWKLRLRRCNLTNLEEALLGVPRVDDLPGALVPERFFSYLKTGDFRLFDDVLEHNAQDIASLCTLLAHMCRMYEHPEQLRFDEDVYSMGVALDRFRHTEEARRCYRLAGGEMHAQGQERLAASYRRCGEKEEAAQVWLGMIARREGGVTPYVEMAKYYEHQRKDIPAALEMVRRAIALVSEPSLFDETSVQEARNALQYRYDRLRRKQGRSKE
ncbi:MAG: ribonuclease H-like domain-containing protein [Clostridia bacterium]|nr:ribonuclease H-like domain-containing protein [Clostridia bacterium]